jgi:hypothetical protein
MPECRTFASHSEAIEYGKERFKKDPSLCLMCWDNELHEMFLDEKGNRHCVCGQIKHKRKKGPTK